MHKIVLVLVLVVLLIAGLYCGGCLSRKPAPDPSQVVIASVGFNFPNGASVGPDALIDPLAKEKIRTWVDYSSELEPKARKAIKKTYESVKYVTSVEVHETTSPVSFTDLEKRLSADSPDRAQLRADRQYIDLTYEVTETRNPRPGKKPVRLKPPKTPELESIRQKLKLRIEDFANAAFDQTNAAIFGDSATYTSVTSDLRPDNLDEILKALYLYDLAYISSHVYLPKEADVEASKERKADLLELAKKTRQSANSRLSGSDYRQGYAIWINLLLEHRRKQVGNVENDNQMKLSMTEIMKLTPVVETNKLGKYRLDGSVVTLAYYAILSLEADAGDSSALRTLLTETGFTSDVLPKLIKWNEGLYSGTSLGSFPPEPKMKYAKGQRERDHLVGGKLLHHLAISYSRLRKDPNDPQGAARASLDDLKRVLLTMRKGELGAEGWKTEFTYYDFCYVMRALTLAAKYEFEYFANENQCTEYLDWANELSGKQQLKPTPDFSSESTGDVSIYYYHLAHTSLAREFSDLENDVARAIRDSQAATKQAPAK
ncbi:hypothetical protein LOC67_09155 [Stieleria sp. JC731]|uniref:hypothetical protein n=1 Tax=Pirellulaceae TaxID=2691357 RepID=UPI001E5E261F|nr:hypothetical protein [Stieleria sp. JC731]MCC9600730.1 hypothetical protein [Stieleria sp. JC731]